MSNPNAVATTQSTDITVGQPRDLLAGKSIDELFDIAERFASTQMVPKNFINKGGDIAVCWAFGASLGLNAMQSLTSIAVVNGTPSVFGTAVGALMQAQPRFDDMVERNNFHETDERMQWWAECEVRLAGREPVIKRYSMKMATAAGLTGKDNWKNHPQMMLENRARNWVARVAFPGALKGMPVREEILDEAPMQKAEYTVREDAPPPKGNAGLAQSLESVTNEPTTLRASLTREDDGEDPGTVFYSREQGATFLVLEDGKLEQTDAAQHVEILRSRFSDALRGFIEDGGPGVPDAKALRQFCKKHDALKKVPKTLEEVTIPTLSAAYDLIVQGYFPMPGGAESSS